jgi:hypothetical protein
MTTTMSAPPVVVCATEQEYYDAIQNAGDKLVVVDCYADWYVCATVHKISCPLHFFQLLFCSPLSPRVVSCPVQTFSL